MDDIILTNSGLKVTLRRPGTYYKGTRFDHCGVFGDIEMDGAVLADRWFDEIDPLRHDNLYGCSEEFAPIWLSENRCLKIGTGILDVPEGRAEFQRFKTYQIVDNGEMLIEEGESECRFTHTMPGLFEYEKVVRLTSGNSFEIRHNLKNTGTSPIDSDCYNHNFFTFGKRNVGPSRLIDFPAPPSGEWREDSVCAHFDGCGIRFSGTVPHGCKAFVGNLQWTTPGGGYEFCLSEGKHRVKVSCPHAMHHAVYWNNDRVACVEPYVNIDIAPGASDSWTISYLLRDL